MTNLPSSELLTLWDETSSPTGVYIHSPFCKEQCEYCTYKGTLFNREEFARYYDEYLPSLFELYKNVLGSDKIDNYFFGGGTPSLMTPKIMRSIFSKIPNFKEITKKTIEFHMVDWTEEKLDIIKEFNFNTVVACVQTFDSKKLRQQKRRVPRDDKSIGNFISYSLSIGLNVMSDLIYFNTGDTKLDGARLINDLERLALYETTQITIQSIFDTLWRDTPNIGSIINEFLSQHPEYYLDNALNFDNKEGSFKQKGARLYRKTHTALNVYPQIDSIEGISTQTMHLHTTNVNTLGIGSYKNHKHTFSKIEDKFEFIEDGDTYNPKWLLSYSKADNPVSKLVANFYKKLEDNIGDPPDGLTFTFQTITDSVDGDTRNKVTERKLVPTFKYESTSNIIEDYLKKLKKLIPEWDFYTG
jgi:hypothetical protein